MTVKPLAFVVLATLVVAGAGTGAYLAVRDNRSQITPNAESTQVGALFKTVWNTPHAIKTTAELISDGAPTGRKAIDRNVVSQTKEAVAASTKNSAHQPELNASVADPANAGDTPAAEISWHYTQSRPVRPNESAVAAVFEAPFPVETPSLVALATVQPATVGRPIEAEEPPRIVRDLVIAAGSVVGLQLDTSVSTEDALVEDHVEARVTRDVIVDDQIAVPAETRVLGSVVLVERANEFRGAARLGVRFHTIVFDDVFDLPIGIETVYRQGEGSGSESAAKIGGAAVGGAILGAIFGGRQGAAIGSAVGAAGGTAAAMAGNGQPAILPAGSILTVRVSRPATVTIEY
jgi:hypothetical protein